MVQLSTESTAIAANDDDEGPGAVSNSWMENGCMSIGNIHLGLFKHFEKNTFIFFYIEYMTNLFQVMNFVGSIYCLLRNFVAQ